MLAGPPSAWPERGPRADIAVDDDGVVGTVQDAATAVARQDAPARVPGGDLADAHRAAGRPRYHDLPFLLGAHDARAGRRHEGHVLTRPAVALVAASYVSHDLYAPQPLLACGCASEAKLGMPPAKLGLIYGHTGLQRFIDAIDQFVRSKSELIQVQPM